MSAGEHLGDDELVHLALTDPSRAVVMSEEVLSQKPDEARAITALRARGLARRHLGDFEASAADLVSAQQRADAIGDDNLWAGAGLSLAGTWVFQGRVTDAKMLLARCIERAQGETRIEAIYQLGTTCAQAGDLDLAVQHYAEALPLIQTLNKPTWEGNLLGNRGVMNIYRGKYDDAIADLDAAIKLHADQGPSMYSLHRGNKAYALQLRGDLAAAIDLYDENERFQQEHDLPTLMYSQRCTAYLAAGMYEDAMDLAQRAHQFHTQGHAALGAIEALLPGAEAALALNNTELAHQLAQAAIDLDEEGSFPALTARAQISMIEARYLAGTSEPGDIAATRALSASVRDSDSSVAVRAMLVGARIALTTDDKTEALRSLNETRSQIDAAPLHARIEWNSLRARSVPSDEHAVLEALDDGLKAFDELVAGVASYDVRYKAARHVEALATGAVDLLLRSDSADVVPVIERIRAGALLVDGRQTESGPTKLLDDESYLVWFESNDRLLCMATSSDGMNIHDCGALQPIDAAAEEHRFAHRQIARQARFAEHTRESLIGSAERTDGLLAELLLPSDSKHRVIINPPARLAGVLWSALPAMQERSITVAPSLALTRRRTPEQIRRVTIAGDTSLPFVPLELDAVAAVWDTQPQRSSDPEDLATFASADLLHVAGHFVAHASNPLYSAIPLSGIELRGSDYLKLQPPPRIAVLSACSSGQGTPVAGAHVGFASAALAAGTATVILTQTTIEDGAIVVATMQRLHQLLNEGQSAADALLAIRTGASRGERSAICAFTVLGSGW